MSIGWRKSAGVAGWCCPRTKDERIRRNPLERAALEQAGVRAFFLTKQGLTGPEMAVLFVQALMGMRNRAVSQAAPFIYTLSASGQFSLVR